MSKGTLKNNKNSIYDIYDKKLLAMNCLLRLDTKITFTSYDVTYPAWFKISLTSH